jgi:putative iron-dependent peroxidase
MTDRHQRAVLEPVPPLARYLAFDLRPGADPGPALAQLVDLPSPERTVIGIGEPLALALGARIPGLRAFPGVSGPSCSFPSTQAALWAFFAGEDATDLHDRSLAFARRLGDGFRTNEEVACFRYRDGRDLSGYVDGTENPTGDRALAAAIVTGAGPGLDGSTFVAAQRYVHELERLARLAPDARDAVIGRRLSDDTELAEAPAAAHVKRAAQETFDPPAFVVRRSMPWGVTDRHGLYFVAFGESLDRFERILRRMAGQEDGIVDALLGFTRAETGGYYFCPPVDDAGRLDLRALRR